MTFHFLKCYPSEAQLAASFSISEKTARKWRWFFARQIQALKIENGSCDTTKRAFEDVLAGLVTEPFL
jgi:hypothetical protein